MYTVTSNDNFVLLQEEEESKDPTKSMLMLFMSASDAKNFKETVVDKQSMLKPIIGERTRTPDRSPPRRHRLTPSTPLPISLFTPAWRQAPSSWTRSLSSTCRPGRRSWRMWL